MAYRRLAKRWHPDRAGTGEAAQRMAEINAAYDLLREGAGVRPPVVVPDEDEPARPRAAAPGAWLAPELRRALGEELLVALEHARGRQARHPRERPRGRPGARSR